MFDQLTSISVSEAVKNLDNARFHDGVKPDISFFWFLDAGSHWSFDPVCKIAVERANETLKGAGGMIVTSSFTNDTSVNFFHSSLRPTHSLPSSTTVLWSRLDSDDLIHADSLKLMVEGAIPCALKKGFCFFSFLERAQWFLDPSSFLPNPSKLEAAKCGRITNFWFPIHSQLQAYAFVPSLLNCSTLFCIQEKGFEPFDHTKVVEFLMGAPYTHFPHCRENMTSCTRFSCFGKLVEGRIDVSRGNHQTLNPPPQCTFHQHPLYEPLVFWTMSPMQTSRWRSASPRYDRKDPCELLQSASVSPPFHFDSANRGCIALGGPQIGCHTTTGEQTLTKDEHRGNHGHKPNSHLHVRLQNEKKKK